MAQYTIKSISPEGIYYLVNGWRRHKRFWLSEDFSLGKFLIKQAMEAN